ncbi:MAG: PIN domain-containing protein [Atopobiaceae bacterium]|nr:PIN domain-containing protein [Atopobiaceae bacterium]
MYRIMLDTNVLVDYYLGREPGCSACKRIIELSNGSHALYVAAVSLKDVYYLVGATLKRLQRLEAGTLTESDALACTEIAWSCVRNAMEVALVANTGRRECLDAIVYRSVHNDFEDNLVLAAARSSEVDIIVTCDERLAQHSPMGALSPQALVRLLEADRLA